MRKDVENKLEELCRPVARSMGLEVVQVQYRHESEGWVLRILVDKDVGVTVDECGSLSRELSDVLDVEDLIENHYRLEVSSPGLDRPLVSLNDFEKYAGNQINLTTKRPIDGQRNFKGQLIGVKENLVLLKNNGDSHELEWSEVEHANLIPDWDKLLTSAGN